MIVLSKLFTVLVLPPGCFIAALIVVIVFVPRKSRLALAIITVLLYVLSIQPVSDLLLRPLENAYPPLWSRQADAINPNAVVILGGGTIQGSPEDRGGGDTLGTETMKRTVYAFSLRNDFTVPGLRTPYIFSGGKVFDHNQESEADTAGRFLVDLGLDPERLILETQSRNTWQNARETARFGYRRVILVTSAYHMRRSVFCFERNGMTVIPAPTDYKCDRNRPSDFLSFLPSMGSLYKSYLALHEYTGLLIYRIIYGLIQP